MDEKGTEAMKMLVVVCNLLQMNIVVSKAILEGRVADMDIPDIKNI